MPTYNEESNIRDVVDEWYPMLDFGDDASKMVISDGGSSDKTLDILYKLQKEYPRIVVIPKPGTDHGTKLVFLYQYAIDNNADWIFQTDSDGQTVSTEFPDFWKLRDSCEAVIGNRTKRGDGLFRVFVERILRIYLKVFFNASVPDANAPFRLMKKDLIKKYIYMLPWNFNLPNAVLSACFARYHETVIYKEITFQPRQGGRNYMNPKRILKIGLQSVKNFIEIRITMRSCEKNGALVK